VRESGYDVRSGLVLGLSDLDFASYELLSKAILSSDNPPPNGHPDTSLAAQGFVLYDVIVRPESAQTARIWARYQPISFSGSPVDKLGDGGAESGTLRTDRAPPADGAPNTVATAKRPAGNDAVGQFSRPQVSEGERLGLGYPEHSLTVLTCYGLFTAVPPDASPARERRSTMRVAAGIVFSDVFR
jgi:hypothetical protein